METIKVNEIEIIESDKMRQVESKYADASEAGDINLDELVEKVIANDNNSGDDGDSDNDGDSEGSNESQE